MNQRIILLVLLVAAVKGLPIEKVAEKKASGSQTVEVTGVKRSELDLATEEQEAGKAVLKLLDAKIGRKVQDAAKEVTEFLASAVGHHATSRADKMHSDREKEISLLHLGASKAVTNQAKLEDKPKKKKDGSFLVHFKIPYIVTPIKPKKKAHHHHHKHHHHHHHHHHNQHKSKNIHDIPPPVTVGHTPYGAPPQPQAPPPNYQQPGTVAPTSYTTGIESVGLSPCQGMCTAPCTPQCSPSTDCCCCPDQSAAVPPSPVTVAIPPPPMLPPPMPPPPQMLPPPSQFPPPGSFPLAEGSCLPACKRHCFSYCPLRCCGKAGKRSHVAGAKKSEEKDTSEKNDEKEEKPQQSEEEVKKAASEDDNDEKQTGEVQQTKEKDAKEPEAQPQEQTDSEQEKTQDDKDGQKAEQETQQTDQPQETQDQAQQTQTQPQDQQTSEDQREEGSANEAEDEDDVA